MPPAFYRGFHTGIFEYLTILLPYLGIHAMNLENQINKVLQSRKADTDMLNVMEALGYDQDKFQEAFDVALAMDNKNLVKLIYSNYNQGKVIVEFTLLANKAV